MHMYVFMAEEDRGVFRAEWSHLPGQYTAVGLCPRSRHAMDADRAAQLGGSHWGRSPSGAAEGHLRGVVASAGLLHQLRTQLRLVRIGDLFSQAGLCLKLMVVAVHAIPARRQGVSADKPRV